MPANSAARAEAKVNENAAETAAQANNVTALKGQDGEHLLAGDRGRWLLKQVQDDECSARG